MNVPWQNLHGPARVLAFCATVLLVASGLCGIQAVLVFSSPLAQKWEPLFLCTGIIELVAIAICTLVAVCVLIWWFVSAITSRRADTAGASAKSLGIEEQLSERNSKNDEGGNT